MDTQQDPQANSVDIALVAELQKLNDSSLDTDGRYKAVCILYAESIRENALLKEEVKNMGEQMEKYDQTNGALKKLTAALRTQIDLTKEEGDLKLKEETQKRIECSQQFQATVAELSELVTKHSGHNGKLRDENNTLASRLTELMGEYEQREKRIDAAITEYKLQLKLYEAQLAKAKIEKAELSADFTKERIELHKSLVESKHEAERTADEHARLQEQMDVYKKQFAEMEKNVGTNSQNFGVFRSEMERLGKKLRTFERDTAEWKERFETSNDQVRKMNAESAQRERELESVKKKLAAMEKLNRALQEERKALMAKDKEDKKEKADDEQQNTN